MKIDLDLEKNLQESSKNNIINFAGTKTIDAVTVDKICMKSLPCCHKVTIFYQNELPIIKTVNVQQLVDTFWNYLDDDMKNHCLQEPAVAYKLGLLKLPKLLFE